MFGNGFRGFFGGGMEEDDSQSQSHQGEVDNKSLYEMLGLQAGASTDEVKKAFRKKAVKEHPDKGGDAEKFKKLTEAYEILSNPEKKDLYDRYGLEGVKNGGASGGDMGDILGGLFGFGGGRRDTGPKKMKGKLRELNVTLEDVYEGKMIDLKHTRKRICAPCEGKGGKNAVTCGTCKGKRMVQKMTMLGPGMYSQQTGPCDDCRGEGVKMSEKDKCKVCKGQRVVDDDKVIQVPLEKGVPDEHDYTFYGEGDEVPGVMAGDLFVRVKIQKHREFERKGADLFMEKKITLVEALTGCQISIKFLDGSTLNITTTPNQIISPGQFFTVKKRGMPFYKSSMDHGDLHIRFQVEFPRPGSLKPDQLQKLQELLPQPTKKVVLDSKKPTHILEPFSEDYVNSNPEGGRLREEEEEERGHHGGQRVQCAQQ